MPTTSKGITYPTSADNVAIATDVQTVAENTDSIWASQTYNLTTKGDLLYRSTTAPARLPVGATNNTVLTARPSATPPMAWESPVTSDVFRLNTFTGTTSTVTFSGIPSTYRDLIFEFSGRLTGVTSGQINITIAGATFSTIGGSPGVAAELNSATPLTMDAGSGDWNYDIAGSTSGTHISKIKMRIYDYASVSRVKMVDVTNFASSSTQNFTVAFGSAWFNANEAITSMTIRADSAPYNFYTGTQFTLWGVR